MASTPFLSLLDSLSSLDVEKFDRFRRVQCQYKRLESKHSGIFTDILIPNVILEKRGKAKCPVIVRIHGGFLITGSSHYAPWFSTWILDYAIKNEAIIVSPNYRLLPEVNGEAILEDLDDFWNWLHTGSFHSSLAQIVSPKVSADMTRILVLGESAGGYLAIQLALSYPTQIRGVVAAYPMLDLKSPFYSEKYSKPIVGVPNLPNAIIEDHLSAMKTISSSSITSADPPERLELAFAIVQNARFLEFFGIENSELFPLERIERLGSLGALSLPPTFIFHGEQDSAVPVDGSRKFVALLREISPNSQVQLHMQDGDHGFDADSTLETPWLRDGLRMASKEWLPAQNLSSQL